jgi:hypothetical protein
MCRRQYDK